MDEIENKIDFPEAVDFTDLSFFSENKDRLVAKVNSLMVELGVSEENHEHINEYLKMIKDHNEPTYLHSLRVGILASEIAKSLGLESRPLFIAGLLHDLGKVTIGADTLDKKDSFTEEDYAAVKNHVLEGYNFLVDRFSYSAEILVRHHSFGENPYPTYLPNSHIFKGEALEKIEELSRFLSLIDFYDAISSRKNEKFKNLDNNPEAKKKIILDKNQDEKELILKLYEYGLFI